MIPNIELAPGKKVYFASDFHLGVPDKTSSQLREKRIVQWLTTAEQDAAAIFLVGDIFDFWFEYAHVIPKGYLRFQAKLAAIRDKGIPIYFFTGNHDMWMFSYFEEELGIPIVRKPVSFTINGVSFHVGHGDGLGPGDGLYKVFKKIFANKLCQWAFKWLHPDIGMGIAHYWSRSSRAANTKKEEKSFGKEEWLVQYCKEVEARTPHRYYLFGHRHLPFSYDLHPTATYINLGEWVHYNTYAVFDGEKTTLTTFQPA